jgi:hypothetical protein
MQMYTPEDGRVRPEHVVSTNNKKANDLVTLMDNKKQILSDTIILEHCLRVSCNKTAPVPLTQNYFLNIFYSLALLCLISLKKFLQD